MNIRNRITELERSLGTDGEGCPQCKPLRFGKIDLGGKAPEPSPAPTHCPSCGRWLPRFGPVTFDGDKRAIEFHESD